MNGSQLLRGVAAPLLAAASAVALLVAPLPGSVAHAKDDGDPCARPQDQLDAVDAELLAAWKADVADRETSSPDTAKNDAKRLKAVTKLIEKGYVCSPINAFHAAFVLQRSKDPAQLSKAYELAKQAMDARLQNGAWLTAITYDLLQVSSGKPQRYGTQIVSLDDKVCLYPVLADVTDEERKQYQIRPISETYRQVLDANGLQGAVAQRQSLDLEELWCPASAWGR